MIMTSIDLEMNQPSGKIIQIGLCRGNVLTGEIFDKKRIYVKIDEPLQEFIINLTGITEDKLAKDGISLQEAYEQVVEFHKLSELKNPLAWGAGDTRELKEQLELQGMKFSPGFGVDSHLPTFCFGFRCFDVKQSYQEKMIMMGKNTQGGLAGAMRKFKFPFEGKKHDGMDDAVNTFRFYHYLFSKTTFDTKDLHEKASSSHKK